MPAKVVRLNSDENAVHWIYLVGSPNGEIKVGRTTNPRVRLATHKRDLGAEWCHLLTSGTKTFIAEAERELIKDFSKAGKRVRSTERFSGMSRAGALEVARVVIEWLRDRDAVAQARRDENADWVASGLVATARYYPFRRNTDPHPNMHPRHAVAAALRALRESEAA